MGEREIDRETWRQSRREVDRGETEREKGRGEKKVRERQKLRRL